MYTYIICCILLLICFEEIIEEFEKLELETCAIKQVYVGFSLADYRETQHARGQVKTSRRLIRFLGIGL